jgi:hypothetical protein
MGVARSVRRRDAAGALALGDPGGDEHVDRPHPVLASRGLRWMGRGHAVSLGASGPPGQPPVDRRAGGFPGSADRMMRALRTSGYAP